MAIDELDEHEQGERVRQWLRQNGASIVLGIGAGIAALAGWNYWQNAQREHTAKAQLEFQSLLEAETRGDAAAVEKAAATLRGEFAKTPYGALAALNQARDALRKGDHAAAEAALEWARGARVGVPALAELVELRLAQVKLAKGEAQAVLDVLARIKDGQYKGPAAELRGDALVALGRPEEARAAYEDALAALDQGSPQRDFVVMKRDDIGATPAQSAPAAPAAAAEPAAKANS
jgi:predicted negative regulator of RcsB-dependent stress response